MENLRRFQHVCMIFITLHGSLSSQLVKHTYTRKSCYGGTGCVEEEQNSARSKIDCSVKCGNQQMCSGFTFDRNGTCWHLSQNCFQSSGCSSSDPTVGIYKKEYCQNGGRWDNSSNTCICSNTGGYVGTYCDRLPYHCKDLYLHKYPAAIHQVTADIYQNMSRLITITCWVDQWSWVTYVFANSGTNSHNKTWQEYVDGYNFPNDKWNHWLGLRNLFDYRNIFGKINVAFVAGFQNSVQYNFRYRCLDFVLQDASHGNAFSSQPCYPDNDGPSNFFSNSHTLGDIMGMSQNQSFSTPDHDNDDDLTENCAERAGAGWWFRDCTGGVPANPLGFGPNKTPLPSNTDTWISLPGLDFLDPELHDYFSNIHMIFYTDTF